MVEIDGAVESYAMLQVWSPPPNAPPELKLGKLGTHAIAFTGLVDLLASVCTDEVEKKKAELDEDENSSIDNPFTWDLDVTVGSGLEERRPSRSAHRGHGCLFIQYRRGRPVPGRRRVPFPEVDRDAKRPAADRAARDRQTGGRYLQIQRLSYSVTATGDLAHPENVSRGLRRRDPWGLGWSV